MAGSFDPHVIVAELGLPGVTPEALCAEVRALPGRPRSVVLLSGLPPRELAKRAALARANHFHAKSRGLGELMDLLDALTAKL